MSTPKFIAVLHRKIKPGNTYADFYNAWLPPGLEGKDPTQKAVEYFNAPVQVINAVNVNDPSDIISIGIIWATLDEIAEDVKRTADTEDIRAEKVFRVAEQGQENKFYAVKDVNLLGSKLP